MARSRKQTIAGPPLKAPETVGFRLDPASRVELAKRADRLGVSPHVLAREYVIEMLHEPEERRQLREAVAHLGEGVGTLFQQVFKSREDLATVAEALLVQAGNVDPKKASQWVDDNFR